MSTIIKSGYLTKEGGLRKTWKKRWFVLRHDTLSYYRNEVCSIYILCLITLLTFIFLIERYE